MMAVPSVLDTTRPQIGEGSAASSLLLTYAQFGEVAAPSSLERGRVTRGS